MGWGGGGEKRNIHSWKKKEGNEVRFHIFLSYNNRISEKKKFFFLPHFFIFCKSFWGLVWFWNIVYGKSIPDLKMSWLFKKKKIIFTDPSKT